MTSKRDRRIVAPVGDRVILDIVPGGALLRWARGDQILWQGVATSPNHAGAVVKELLRIEDPTDLPGSSSAASCIAEPGQES